MAAAGLRVEVTDAVALSFDDGDPVRAASAIAPFGDGWLLAQDDATHGAWWRPDVDRVERVHLLPAHDGLDVFSEQEATKHLKPDLEAACPVELRDGPGVLLLGSGSLERRTRGVLVRLTGAGPAVSWADLAPLYESVRAALGLGSDELNLEGACLVDGCLRWFQRGHGRSGVPSASVDVDVSPVLAMLAGAPDAGAVVPVNARRYDLGTLGGLHLAITDAVPLPSGRICVSATAEDTPDAIADGPVAGSVIALLAGQRATVAPLPEPFRTCKVEGLALLGTSAGGVRLIAVVDQDEPATPSLALRLTLHGAS